MPARSSSASGFAAGREGFEHHGEPVQDDGGIAQGAGAGGPGRAEVRPRGGGYDQAAQRGGQRGGVVRLDEDPTGVVDDLGTAAEACGDNGQTGVERLDKGDAEGLRAGVRLAVDIRRREQSRDIRALTQKADAVGDPGGARRGVQLIGNSSNL